MTNLWLKIPEQLRKRVASFIWRIAGLTAVALLNAVATNLGIFDLSDAWVAVIGLMIGELTKYISNKVSAGKA